ncbi:MAG: replication-associated recombination protein A [Alphaproteobacteria bacterium]|nr:replication-associated recombination protein A [Alphaproteobacteria bacterium]MDD9919174.1 replication-associated recombination protein A [Alphaproteobacteria bacterium]
MSQNTPLADDLRPQKLADVVGQAHVLGEKSLIQRAIAADKPQSIILWGPPGCGKTTIARLYAKAFQARFEPLSAVLSGVADVRKVVERAKENQNLQERTVLFVDEIHRFNKAQQDAFLPHVEDGTLILIGATTENPSFALNNALLSRAQVLELKPLSEEDLLKLINRAEEKIGKLPLTQEAKAALPKLAQGDGRMLLNMVEGLSTISVEQPLSAEELSELLATRPALYDQSGDGHYNLISALHKAVRGSDPDASLYWLARMLDGGEDPLFLARRLIRMASEDIGLADPQALQQAIAARDAYQMLGSPEGELALAQCTVYLALAPKSNAVYTAFKAAQGVAQQEGSLPPPKHILNAPTKTMKELDYGKHYIYDHDTPNAFSGQHYFPQARRYTFYQPVERGFEREMSKRLEYFTKLREKLTS